MSAYNSTHVTLFEVGFVNNRSRHTRIFQDVLAQVCVHLENIVDCGGFGTGAIRTVGCAAIALFGYDLGHFDI